MQQKIQEMSCQTLISRVEYCVENLEMRLALKRILAFSRQERQMEAVQYIAQIHERKPMFDSLMQWVRVVYAQELHQQMGHNNSNLVNSQMHFTRSQIRSFFSKSICSSSRSEGVPSENLDFRDRVRQKQEALNMIKKQYTGSTGLKEPVQNSPMINVVISELDESEDIAEDVSNEYSQMIAHNYRHKQRTA
jgi:hypothetical protein